ncbi:SH3 domain-containing protein [Bacillus mexicanus]|uniref:SH3 domain-containing protein n=1 Tax=Bacillus mexicanus TaxID=2834415 RepID=UPI003D190133
MMNRKLSLIILFILFGLLITVLLTFMSFSQSGNNQDVGELKTGYDQLTKQVKELKVTTDELNSKVNDSSGSQTSTVKATTPQTTSPASPPATSPATTSPTATKTVIGNKINMRSTPSTGARVVKQLANGEKVTPTGQTQTVSGYSWIQVKDAQGNLGWIVASYIK